MPHRTIAALRKYLSDPRVKKRYAEIKALSGPTRFKIVMALYASPGKKSTVGRLAFVLDSSASRVSHQLSILKKYGFVRGSRAGREVVYALRDHHVTRMLGL